MTINSALLKHFQTAFLLLAIGHTALRLFGKVRTARKRSRGEIHKPGIFNGMMVAYFILFILAISEGSGRTFHTEFFLIGIFFYGVSSWIQWKAFRDLGQAYSPDIEVRREQSLVQHGLYRWVRHPLLAALILEIIAIATAFSAYDTTLLTLVLFVPLVRLRMKEEEKVLVNHFGERYLLYQNEVGGLWPNRVI
jgi:protein-S-isoprenylcysteine O-methyltransferase Ste14